MLSSAEISSSIWTDNELTLVTKTTSITPNTLRLHAFNSSKSNETTNSTTPTSFLLVNQGQVSNQGIDENLNCDDAQNLNACMNTLENAPLGFGPLIEENEEMDEDSKIEEEEEEATRA